MTNFESIFRPFAQIGVTPPVKDNTIGPTTPPAMIRFSVGANGQSKGFSGSFTSSETFYMDAKKKEKARSPSRTTHTKRVYKDNDPLTNPDTWVDVKVIDTIWIQGPNGQFEQWKFTDPDL